MLIYGLNPVTEALRAGKVRRLKIAARHDRRIDEVVALAAKRGVPIDRVDPQTLDRAAKGGVHQGVIAEIEDAREYSLADLILPPDRLRQGSGESAEALRAKAEGGSHLRSLPPEGGSHLLSLPPEGGSYTPVASAFRRKGPLIVVLDGIEDPHNVGAILRTCDAAGVSGVVRQARHSAALDGVVGKASAGALAHVRIATVVNIARAIEELKEAQVWTIGLAGEAETLYTDVDWTVPSAVVVGAEGTGLRRLVRERCDRLVRLPMLGAVESLNVSVAAGVVLYEAVRQRAARHSTQG